MTVLQSRIALHYPVIRTSGLNILVEDPNTSPLALCRSRLSSVLSLGEMVGLKSA